MPVFDSLVNPQSEAFTTNRNHMLRLLAEVRALEQRTLAPWRWRQTRA